MMRPSSKFTRNILPGCKSAFAFDVFRRDREYADFTGHNHFVIMRDIKPARTQTVAVEDRANIRAISEGDGSRTVPGFLAGAE